MAAIFAFPGGNKSMDQRLGRLIEQMVAWDSESHERVAHNLRVFGFALAIAEGEGMVGDAFDATVAAAVVHDAGIRPALEKYGSSDGKYQEKEGGEPAARMLRAAGYDEPMIGIIRELVEHHHTYKPVLGPEHQVLLEADLLVNMDDSNEEARHGAAPSIFRTKTGLILYNELFGADQ